MKGRVIILAVPPCLSANLRSAQSFLTEATRGRTAGANAVSVPAPQSLRSWLRRESFSAPEPSSLATILCPGTYCIIAFTFFRFGHYSRLRRERQPQEAEFCPSHRSFFLASLFSYILLSASITRASSDTGLWGSHSLFPMLIANR